MKHTVELSPDEIKKAVQQYVSVHFGYNADKIGPVRLDINPGCNDQRDYEAPSVKATVSISV
jgi:hypothetical protein